MIFANTLVALALAVSASALATPHVARHAHHGLAARMPHPDPVAQPEYVQVTPPKKRSTSSGRCKARSSTSSAPSSSSVHSSAPAVTSPAAPVNVAPAPPTFSSSSTEAPKTTSTPPPPPKTTSEAAPPKTTAASSSGDEPSFLVGEQHGDGTFYAPGLGACGIVNSGTDMIAAISHQVFDAYPGATANPNDNPICGKTVTATYQGKSVTVKITDRCAGCLTPTDLDFAPSAFDILADASIGRIDIDWVWDD